MSTYVSSNELPPHLVGALHESAVFSRADVAVVEVTGPGAVKCLQGLLTCDLEGCGEHAFVYGALLSAKGMIECDMWVAHRQDHLTLFAPQQGRETLLAALKRFLPPRLAKVTESSEDRLAFRVAGARAYELATSAGLRVPDPGKVVEEGRTRVGRPATDAPFAIQIDCGSDESGRLTGILSAAGIRVSNPATLELVRIMAGWPRLGTEIDHKTLPQEVRFDALGAVSYSKGCYLGQETVARLHFRGHVNRRLQGVIWEAAPDSELTAITHNDQPVGQLTSVVSLDLSNLHIGLGMIRSSVESGSSVNAGGIPARVVDLPFPVDL